MGRGQSWRERGGGFEEDEFDEIEEDYDDVEEDSVHVFYQAGKIIRRNLQK
jgi:hypothetical protein